MIISLSLYVYFLLLIKHIESFPVCSVCTLKGFFTIGTGLLKKKKCNFSFHYLLNNINDRPHRYQIRFGRIFSKNVFYSGRDHYLRLNNYKITDYFVIVSITLYTVYL